MHREPRSRRGVRIDSIDVLPTVLSGPDRLPSHGEAALLLAHLGRYYTKLCRESAGRAYRPPTPTGRQNKRLDQRG